MKVILARQYNDSGLRFTKKKKCDVHPYVYKLYKYIDEFSFPIVDELTKIKENIPL